MDNWLDLLIERAEDHWHTKTGLVFALLAVVGLLIVIFAGLTLSDVSTYEWIIVIVAGLILWLVWIKTSIPKAKKGRLGFGVAIEFEDSDHARQLRSDFVLALRDLLQQSKLRNAFSFVEFSDAVAKRIPDEESALKLAKRAHIHFLLFGRARLRTTPQGPAHILDLRGLVRHVTLPKDRATEFSNDFGSVLPSRMIVSSNGDPIVCEFAARHIDAVARYIIGTAAGFSGDFACCEELLLGSENRLVQYVERAEGAPISALLDKVRKRLAALYQDWLELLMRHYTLRREKGALQFSEAISTKLRTYDPDNYAASLSLAIAAFALRRDTNSALKEIEKCQKVLDGTWLYSEAFLHAYKGDLDKAYQTYKKAFRSSLRDQTVPTQSEEFIQIVLDEEPHRPWLYFCRGLINYRAKGDLESALGDFTKFLDNVDPARFPKQVEAVTKWKAEINNLLTRHF